jgi:hypothetical protein
MDALLKPDAINANALLAERECGKSDTTSSGKSTPIRSRVKGLIVRLAVSGAIPANVATWLIQRGGLRHV